MACQTFGKQINVDPKVEAFKKRRRTIEAAERQKSRLDGLNKSPVSKGFNEANKDSRILAEEAQSNTTSRDQKDRESKVSRKEEFKKKK